MPISVLAIAAIASDDVCEIMPAAPKAKRAMRTQTLCQDGLLGPRCARFLFATLVSYATLSRAPRVR
jgi:hypothetical protein